MGVLGPATDTDGAGDVDKDAYKGAHMDAESGSGVEASADVGAISSPFPPALSPLSFIIQALREGGVDGAVEGLAPKGRRLPSPECLGGGGGVVVVL